MTTIVFDMSDPEIKKLVDGWEDGGTYSLEVKIQIGSGDTRNVASVTSIEAEEMEPEMEDESGMEKEEAPEEKPKDKPKKTPAIPY